jgi:mono/diheme cytochrome c family protein
VPYDADNFTNQGTHVRKALRWLALAVVAVGLVGAAAFGGAVWLGERKRERRVEVRVVPVAFTTDAAALRQGKYLFESRGCGECHGADGAGRVMLDEANGLHVRTPNLTRGEGSPTAAYTEADWVRSIRHGVDPQGRALLVMPSEDYNRLTDADLAAIVGYVRSLPPVKEGRAQVRLPLLLTALYGAGVIPDGAEKIDHRLPPAQPVAVGVTTAHGAYVANMCMGCHGEHFSGGKIPGGPPEWPPAANLTPGAGSVMTRYDTPEKFIAMMRSGKRPDGSEVDKAMPFLTLAAINDTDLQALHAYLHTLAPREAGKR